jgi:hypothetical protein
MVASMIGNVTNPNSQRLWKKSWKQGMVASRIGNVTNPNFQRLWKKSWKHGWKVLC